MSTDKKHTESSHNDLSQNNDKKKLTDSPSPNEEQSSGLTDSLPDNKTSPDAPSGNTSSEDEEVACLPGLIENLKKACNTADSEQTSETNDSVPSEQQNGEPAAVPSSEATDEAEPISPSLPTKEPIEANNRVDDGENGEEENEDEDEDDEEDEEEEEDKPLTLRDHLVELRKRLFLMFLWSTGGFLLCWPFAAEILDFFILPAQNHLPKGATFISTEPTEIFFTHMMVAFVFGIFITTPMLFYQLWKFISPGLYEEEKVFVIPVAICSAVCFLGGASFCYFVALPFAFDFFMSYSSEMIKATPTISSSLSLILRLIFAFGFIFELPLFVFFLSRLGLVTAAMMRKFRRYAILINFIVAAVLTPPDVFSLFLMVGPLLILYEISIVIASIFGKKSSPEPDDEDVNEEDADDTDLTSATNNDVTHQAPAKTDSTEVNANQTTSEATAQNDEKTSLHNAEPPSDTSEGK